MKKNAFLTMFCLLLAVVSYAQNTITLNGAITFANNGDPAAFHPVFLEAGDSLNPILLQTETDPDGNYTFTQDFPAGITSVVVSTITFCDPDFFVSEVVDISNGNATQDFQICEYILPPDECFAAITIDMVNSLTYNFGAEYYNQDSTVVAESYLWDFGDGTTSTDANPTHTYAQEGFYLITLTIVGTDGCTSTMVYPFETGFFGWPDCMGYILYNQTAITSFDFSAEIYDSNGNLVQASSYDWDFGDGNTSTDAAPSHTYADEGIYTVQLHAVTADGCEIHSCDVVFALDCLIDTFQYGCQAMFFVEPYLIDSTGNPSPDPLTLNFWDISLGAVSAWSWDFGDGSTSTAQNPTHTYAQEGIYTVTLSIITLDGCESEVSFSICVGSDCWVPELDCQALFIPLPDSSGGGIQFIDLSISNFPIQSWSWDFGDGTTSAEQNPYHVYAQPGVYTVSLAIEADSCNSVISFEFDTQSPWNFNKNGNPAQLGQSTLSVATKEAQTIFESAKVFPNPATDRLTLAFNSKNAGDLQVAVKDLTGKTLLQNQQAMVAGVNGVMLDVNSLLAGLYLVEIRSGDDIQTIKFVKQ